jgi:hypothetical protein
MNMARTALGTLRFALVIGLFFLVLPLVMAVSRPETGPFERLVLSAATVGLLSLALLIRRIGRPA